MGGLEFQNPWVFILFFLPLVALFRRLKGQKSNLAVPSLSFPDSMPRGFRVWLRGPLLFVLGSVILISLIFAASRPYKVQASAENIERRNIMLCIDFSRSMSARDFEHKGRNQSRINAVKGVVKEFIEKRVDDRIGIVIFGDKAYLQAPLTFDHKLLTEFLELLELGVAGNGTAIGDGLAMALQRMKGVPDGTGAVVLLTDGANNSGSVSPLHAAGIARDLGVRVHTIGIGTPEPVIIQHRGGFFGGPQTRQVEFDEETLKEISRTSGGTYFHADSREGLTRVYQQIDKLEGSEKEEHAPAQRIEYYPWLGWLALLSLLFFISIDLIFIRVLP